MYTRGTDKKPPLHRTPPHSLPLLARTASPMAIPTLIQRAQTNPRALHPQEVALLQRTIGNRAVIQLFRSASPQPSAPVVQREVGFTFPLKASAGKVKEWLGKRGRVDLPTFRMCLW
jgi:hypothetical protein